MDKPELEYRDGHEEHERCADTEWPWPGWDDLLDPTEHATNAEYDEVIAVAHKMHERVVALEAEAEFAMAHLEGAADRPAEVDGVAYRAMKARSKYLLTRRLATARKERVVALEAEVAALREELVILKEGRCG